MLKNVIFHYYLIAARIPPGQGRGDVELVQRGVQGSKIVKIEVQNLQKIGPKGVQMGSKSIKKVVEVKNSSRSR